MVFSHKKPAFKAQIRDERNASKEYVVLARKYPAHKRVLLEIARDERTHRAALMRAAKRKV